MKKKLSVLLATLLVATSIAACGKDGGSNTDNSSISSETSSSTEESSRDYVDGGTMSDEDPHYVDEEKLMHDRKITPSDRVFIQNGATEYSIVLGSSDSRAMDAVTFLRGQLTTATGVTLNLILDAHQDFLADDSSLPNRQISYTSESKYIVFEHEKSEQEAMLAGELEPWRDDVDLEYSGCMIRTAGDSVFTKVNSFYGYQIVAQTLLKEVIGYEWYSYDTIVYTKDGATLPDMDIVEKPDFDLRWNSGKMESTNYMASPLTKQETFAFTKPGMFCHNSLTYIPVETYYADHPAWFALEGGQVLQLCYTAHGIKEEYDAMIDVAVAGIMETLNNNPDAAAITFTREDWNGHCACDTCSMLKKSFNDSLAVTYMFFVNDLDTKVQAELQRIADETGKPKREVTILFFAYSVTSTAPVFGDSYDNYEIPTIPCVEKEDGTKVNVMDYNDQMIELPFHRTYENGLECNEHVGVFYAPIGATYEEDFYHKENKTPKETFEKWGLLSDRLYCWIYDTNFTRYIIPYNSYEAIPDTLRFLKDAGGAFLFNQGDRENGIYTGFGTLRTYLTYTLSNEVNLDAGVLTNKFFENYFREAAPAMRKFYNMLVAHMEQLQVEYPNIFYTQRRTNSEEPKYWPHATLQNWLKLCEEALSAVKKYQSSDPILYESLRKHIIAETIFPRYIICEYYMGYYTPSQVQEWRSSFIADCKLIEYNYHAEGVPIKPIFEKWGLV